MTKFYLSSIKFKQAKKEAGSLNVKMKAVENTGNHWIGRGVKRMRDSQISK